jgi:hypothetical protein
LWLAGALTLFCVLRLHWTQPALIAAGKVVYHISYNSAKFSIACTQQAAYGMRAIFKKLALKNDPWTQCPGA